MNHIEDVVGNDTELTFRPNFLNTNLPIWRQIGANA